MAYKKKDDVDFLLSQCKYVHMQRDKINSIDLRPDFLEQQGFSYNSQTFDDLFIKGWANLASADSSSEDEEDATQGGIIQEEDQQAFDSGSDELE